MDIVARGRAMVAAESDPCRSLAFPGLAVLPSGRWLCACRAAPRKAATEQHVLIAWSDDEGQSWTRPQAPFAAPELDGRPGRFRAAYLTALGGERVVAALLWVDHSDPSLPLFNEETEGVLDCRVFLAFSEDGGETWSKPQLVEAEPFSPRAVLTGSILLLPNGDWACQVELNKAYEDTRPWRHAAVLLFSRDEGRTWHEPVRVAEDPQGRIFYWDQRPAVLDDGRLLDLFWTFNRQRAIYLNIHAGESLDNGRTWSAVWDTGVPGQAAPPVALGDGRTAMVYVDRTGPPAIKARISRDAGRSWPAETECVIYDRAAESQTWRKGSMQDAWSEMAAFSVGLPRTARLPDGDVLVVYYAGPETDRTHIEWARLTID